MQRQEISAIVVAKARYSATVEEQDTVAYFFADQGMGHGPRKTRRPIVERRSVGSPAQFASENAVRVKGLGEKEMP